MRMEQQNFVSNFVMFQMKNIAEALELISMMCVFAVGVYVCTVLLPLFSRRRSGSPRASGTKVKEPLNEENLIEKN